MKTGNVRYELINEIPIEIIEAAQKIHIHFKKKGCESWELMNICSRNHAYKLEELCKLVIELKSLIEK